MTASKSGSHCCRSKLLPTMPTVAILLFFMSLKIPSGDIYYLSGQDKEMLEIYFYICNDRYLPISFNHDSFKCNSSVKKN